jgi:hypothetical protein
MGYRNGKSDINAIWIGSCVIDIGYVLSIWDMVYRYGYLPYRYGHPGYRYGIWATRNDLGDGSIDTVILEIDMGFPVTRRKKSVQSPLPPS